MVSFRCSPVRCLLAGCWLSLFATAALLVGSATAGEATRSVVARTVPNGVEIANSGQKAVFTRGADGKLRLTTLVRKGAEWEPLFDGGAPLVQGPDFDLRPADYRVVEDSSRGAAVELTGRQDRLGYPWTLRVESRAESPFLHFRLTCTLARGLTLSGLEPQFALWMREPAVAMSVDQGPGNIYRGAPEVEWGNSFPAAYLWDRGREAAVFFDMGPMTWMSHRNLFRFRDCRVQAFSEGGRTGFGLRVVRRNFHEVDPGEVVFDAYLYSGAHRERPTRLEGLDRLVRICAPLQPAHAPLPENHVAPYRTSWDVFARGVAGNLMLKDVAWADLPLPEDQPWRDGPLFPEDTVRRVRVSGDYAVDSACEPRFNRTSVLAGWDFSTCNNYLAAWIGYNRVLPDAEQRRFLAAKLDALPLFYDPKARLIRHGTRDPLHVGDREMTWQNLMFALEMVKVYRMLPPEELRPAIPGKFLLGLKGLRELAHNTDYVLPQWFDPYRKQAIAQADEPDLGIVYEPWQVGTYAYLFTEAYAITGDPEYLREARTALDRLFGGMHFRVSNRRYTQEYRDPVDFPITEIFGNAWGVAAAARVHRWTGDERYRHYSDHFLNSLLRMTYWYESALRDDPKDLALHNAGLFRNQGGAFTGSPWENSEAYLALTVRLKLDPEPREPLLRLFDLYRVNSFYFFPPVFPPEAVPCEKLMKAAADYLPIEDAYTHEHGGANGGMGRSVYMSGIAFWNYLLYEAFAVMDDPDLMVLNLDAVDGFDAAARSVERHFLAYNGTPVHKETQVRMRALEDGRYRLMLRRAGRRQERAVTAAELRHGISLTLYPGEHVRIELQRTGSGEAKQLRRQQQARDRIARAYQLLQEAATDPARLPALSVSKRRFREAEAAYRRGDPRLAEKLADRAIRER